MLSVRKSESASVQSISNESPGLHADRKLFQSDFHNNVFEPVSAEIRNCYKYCSKLILADDV